MRNRFRLVPILFAALTGCASTSQVAVSPTFRPVGWESVAVLPFGGPADLTTLATQTFTTRLLVASPYQIVQPGAIAERVTSVRTSGGQFTVSEARNVAENVGASAVVIGNVYARNNGTTLNAMVTVQLVDVATGQVVAASQRDSGRIFASGDDQTVASAAARAAADISAALNTVRAR